MSEVSPVAGYSRARLEDIIEFLKHKPESPLQYFSLCLPRLRLATFRNILSIHQDTNSSIAFRAELLVGLWWKWQPRTGVSDTKGLGAVNAEKSDIMKRQQFFLQKKGTARITADTKSSTGPRSVH